MRGLFRLWRNPSSLSFRVLMGLRPTHRNESQAVTPASAGVHVRRTNWIPACAGMTGLSTEFPWAFGPPNVMKIGPSCRDTMCSAWNREGRLRSGSVEAVTEFGLERAFLNP
jgi:hypothetical protein